MSSHSAPVLPATRDMPDRAAWSNSGWRDFAVVLLIIFFTIAALTLPTEFLLRHIYPETHTTAEDCLAVDAHTGVRGIPYCTVKETSFEGGPTEYRFNGCGNRSDVGCDPNHPGIFRVVLLGTSMTEGVGVEREQSFAALIPKELEQMTGRSIELYNMGLQAKAVKATNTVIAVNVAKEIPQALALKPDLILWGVTQWDIDNVGLVRPGVHADAGPQEMQIGTMDTSGTSKLHAVWRSSVIEPLDRLSTVRVIRHLLYMNQAMYVRQYLLGEGADFLRADTTPSEARHLSLFAEYTAQVLRGTKDAQIPVIVVQIPQRAQTAMISTNAFPKSFDPFRRARALDQIVREKGGTYLSVLPAYREILNPERGFFPIDGHFNVVGHRTFAHAVALGLLKAKPDIGLTRPEIADKGEN